MNVVPLFITSGIAGAWAYLMGVRGRIAEKLALTLVLAGGLSNLLDRMKRGYVVDYFSIQWKALKRVVFNLADIFILLGSGILVAVQVVSGVMDWVKERKK